MDAVDAYQGFNPSMTFPHPPPYALLDVSLDRRLMVGCIVESVGGSGTSPPLLHTLHDKQSGYFFWATLLGLLQDRTSHSYPLITI